MHEQPTLCTSDYMTLPSHVSNEQFLQVHFSTRVSGDSGVSSGACTVTE